ncbi:MAG: DUF418 domain-containing protein [Pseudomonadota bacterium]
MTTTRALMPDYLRLFALFGIVAVNAPFMAYTLIGGFDDAPQGGLLNEATIWLVDGLFTSKSYGLFSFMFGVGLAFMMRSAEARGLSFRAAYLRRMTGLFVLGVIHGCLFYPYDILALYGVMGTFLYLMRNKSPRGLVIWGLALIIVQFPITAALDTYPRDDWADPNIEVAIMTGGSFAEVISFRTREFLAGWVFTIPYQGLSSLGWFCLGLAAVRAGLIDNPSHRIWARARWLLIPGVVLSLTASALWAEHDWASYLLFGSAPIATAGYLGVIASVARPPSPAVAASLLAGGSSLTIYLGQSILLTTIFSPYGLDLWSELGPLAVTLTAWAVTILLIGFVLLWRRAFRLGPFEWVLRQITYAGLRKA